MRGLPLDFNSVMGTVATSDIWNSLWLMLKGMIGIFIVMGLIYFVIVMLGKLFDKKKVKDQEEGRTK